MKFIRFINITVLILFLSACEDTTITVSSEDNNNGGNGTTKDTCATSTYSGTGEDPLKQYQWYYKNTGQTAFAGLAGVADKDMNVDDLHSSEITGSGITVMVMDDGVEMNHDDINTKCANSYNVNDGTNNPSPVYKEDAHGTSVAGIIAMKKDNGIGGAGLAPGALIIGGNFLGSDVSGNRYGAEDSERYYLLGISTSTSQTKIAANSIADVFNNSWGNNGCSTSTFDATNQGYFTSAHEGRDGKGQIYVKAAGNGFKDIPNGSTYCSCSYANSLNISCQNANLTGNPYNTIPEFIIVGAFNADGKASSYSTHGSNIWVSAAGGEYGHSNDRAIEKNNIVVPISSVSENVKPAMVTTDLMNCNMGYSRSTYSANDFNYDLDPGSFSNYVIIDSSSNLSQNQRITLVGPHNLNKKCDYNSTMNGTSSSSPATSAVIALMLQANPLLTWRDVKHILASTAKSVSDDSSINYSDVSVSVGGDNVIIDDGWITNNAGHEFSNGYGFGRVDAKAAVTMAQSYTTGSLGTYQNTTSSSATTHIIPNSNSNGVSSIVVISKSLTIEYVRVELDVTHELVENILITLTSPKGTNSILFWPKSGYRQNGFEDLSLASNAFYGEKSEGNWTLKIVDVGSSSGTNRTLDSWDIEIYGH